MHASVVIDRFPESLAKYHRVEAVVLVDVIRATTTAVTVVAKGGRCFPAGSLNGAIDLARKLENPLLVGELGGSMPVGFHMDNSPSKLALLSHFVGPVVLLSSSGTVLMHEARKCAVSYVACFRNFDATARYICGRHRSVAIIGAGSRGEFREEDQMCCAWMAQHLVEQGYKAKNRHTEELVERWRGVPPSACAGGKSATFLRSTGQSKDLDFVLTHVNDLDGVYTMQKGEVVALYRAGAVTQKRHEYISKTGRAMVSA